MEGYIKRMVGARTSVVKRPSIIQCARTREEFCSVIFMKGKCHNTICRIEGLLDAVTVMDVDIDVEDTRVVQQQLENCENDIVDVAEAGGFGLLRMV